MNVEQQLYYHLGVALAIGLLIGVERGWKARETGEGERVAGVRTYGLLGFLGGVLALLAQSIGALVLGLAFVGLAGVLTAVYVANLKERNRDAGITSLVAGLLTFVLGALAATGQVGVAAASAVVATLLLGYKPLLHHWVSVLSGDELRAGIKLLLISVVLLPVLPNRGFGPWQALNPYAIWWLVVLIASISFIGYFAVRIGGVSRGIVFTGLFGGLASSTALTLHFSRMARRGGAMAPILATGILLACGTMFPRMLLVASVISPRVFQPMVVPTAVMASLAYLPAVWYWRVQPRRKADAGSPLKNPLVLKTALSFGVLLAVVMLLGKALRSAFGNAGIFALAAASGVADVDAITVSLAHMAQDDLALRVAVLGMVIAGAVNTVAKGGIAVAVGGATLALRVGAPLLVSAVGGLVAVALWAR
jgi:uncharacterized membrane protein (DUF4010 family)